MERRRVGIVSALWRYPIKSMRGERLSESVVSESGLVGDRAYALKEAASGRVISAKKWANMLSFRASYETPPAPGRAPRVRVELPGAQSVQADDERAAELLSAALGRAVRLERARADEFPIADIDPATIFGDVSAEVMKSEVMPELVKARLRGKRDDAASRWLRSRVDELIARDPAAAAHTDPTIVLDTAAGQEIVREFAALPLPDSFGLPKGTFFDSAAVHVLASGTLDYLKGLSASDSDFAPRRFRPNIFVQTDDPPPQGFVEDRWLGGVLEIGDSVRITAMRPAIRCVMTTHAQEELARDLAILRTVAEHHRATLGLFCSVGAPGTVRVGDPVVLVL